MDDNRKIFSLITDGFNPDYQQRNNNKICMFTKTNNEGGRLFLVIMQQNLTKLIWF